MLGRYPFVEPSRCQSRDVGEKQLRQLLNAGITTFVCLQASFSMCLPVICLPACLPARLCLSSSFWLCSLPGHLSAGGDT